MERPATTRPTLIAAVIAVCGCMNLAAAAWMIWARPSLNTDFLAFWSFPRFARIHDIEGIYNAEALQHFQAQLYHGFHSFYPYLYPPTFLLPSWWLADFGYWTAQAIWTAAGLALFVGAGCWLFKPPLRWPAVAAMLAGPACLLNFMTGETAFFTTALLLAGFAALPKRPVLAGVAFGLLTLKPQLGVLIPIALVARGDWRAMASAAVVAGGLIALSCVVFPSDLWPLWLQTLPSYQADYFAGKGLNLNIIVTPAANLVALGVAPNIAWLVQIGCSAAVAAGVFRIFRRGPYELAVAALLAGSFLAVPHAYAYDSITLTAAMALCWRAGLPLWQVLLGLAVYLGPFLLLSPASNWFIYAPVEALLFVSIIMLAPPAENRAR